MKNKNRLHDYFNHCSSSAGTSAWIALLTGLAVGATLGILFAPRSGRQLRKRLLGPAGEDLQVLQDEPQQVTVHHPEHPARKRPKSDIKNLIHQAHTGEIHTEQEQD